MHSPPTVVDRHLKWWEIASTHLLHLQHNLTGWQFFCHFHTGERAKVINIFVFHFILSIVLQCKKNLALIFLKFFKPTHDSHAIQGN